MKRHAQTAIAAIDASGRDSAMGGGYDIDPGWDEYDHRALTAERVSAMTPREFQPLLEEALAGLVDGRDPRGHRRLVRRLAWKHRRVPSSGRWMRPGSGQHVAVFTSGGPIATVVSHLLAGDDSLFIRLNAVIVNASVTTIINGSTGPRVLSFNEHTHLPRDLVTFR